MKAATKYNRKPRPFLGYDGEGTGKRYQLLAHSTAHIWRHSGLSTLDCLKFLARPETHNPIRVFFSFGYDVAHIVRNLSDKKLRMLYKNIQVTYRGYKLQLIPRKILFITHKGKQYTYYDVWSFFNSSFVGACKKFLGEVHPLILEGKEARSDFSKWVKEKIIEYNSLECVYLERLMFKLRELFLHNYPGLPSLLPRSWHGPGALANKILRAADVGEHVYPEKSYSDAMRERFARAFFGGRIESFLIGRVKGTIYRYDIRSAYPAAYKYLPRLSWNWRHVDTLQRDAFFGLYRLKWDWSNQLHMMGYPGLLPFRTGDGRIYFPARGEGWYWYPEVVTALELGVSVEVTEGYIMELPYTFPLRGIVQNLYDLRATLKRDDDPREYPLKIAANSLYGKTAQKVGSKRYQSIAWAGFITSFTRAKIARAMYQSPDNIIASLTDGLITSAPLELPLTEKLGDWEMDTFDDCTMLLPGVYRLNNSATGKTVTKWRGFNMHSFDYDGAIAKLSKNETVSIPCPVFIAHPLAIHAPTAYGPHRLDFVDIERRLHPLTMMKRRWHAKMDENGWVYPDLHNTVIHSRQIVDIPGNTNALSAPYDAFLSAFDTVEMALRDASDEPTD